MSRRHKSPVRLELARIERGGLNLSINEDRALTAVQILLDKHTFPDTARARCEDSPGFPSPWPSVKSVPILRTTWDEYLEAYAIEAGKTPQVARDALKRIAGLSNRPRPKPFYARSEHIKAEQVALQRLIYLPEPSRRKDLLIVPTPPLWESLDASGEAANSRGQFYVLKDNSLFPKLFEFLKNSGRLGASGEWKQAGYLRLLYKILTQARNPKNREFRLSTKQLQEELRIGAASRPEDALAFARDFNYLRDFEQADHETWLLRAHPSTYEKPTHHEEDASSTELQVDLVA